MKESTNEIGAYVACIHEMAHRGSEKETPQRSREGGGMLSGTESMATPWLTERCEEQDNR